MILAAYVVGGFLIASVYAAGMLRGRRDGYHRRGFIIAFTVAAIAMPIQMKVGDSLARWVYNNQPIKFAAIELVPSTASDVPETLLGHLNADGTVVGGIPIPGLASWLSDPSTGTATVIEGLNTVPDRPRADHPAGEHRAPGLGRHGGRRIAVASPLGLVRDRVAVPTRHADGSLVPPARGLRRRPRGDHHGGGLGGDGSRSSTMDRVQPHEGSGCRHGQHGRVDHVPHGGRDLCRARDHHHRRPARDEPTLPGQRGSQGVPYGPRERLSAPADKVP